MGRLDGKVAVITGGASGIGQATVMRFLAEGARVVFGDLHDEHAQETLALASAGNHGDNICYLRTDVIEDDQVGALIDLASDKFGRLDCVYNNAGIGGVIGPFSEMDMADVDRTLAVLIRSVVSGLKHGSRVLKAQGEGGVILSTSSVAGISGAAGPSVYSAAKAAVINLTKNAALELAMYRIRVNAIAPGLIYTPLATNGDEKNIRPEMKARQPWPDPGQPDDIANAALFLASDESRFVTGHNMVVDGGVTSAGANIWGFGAESIYSRFTGFNEGTTGKQSHSKRLK